MKTLMMTLAALSSLCFAASEITELDVPQSGPCHYELVSAYGAPMLVIETAETSRRSFVLRYYLDGRDCIALSISVSEYVWDAKTDDWARDASGKRTCTVKKMLLYPHERHRFKEAQLLLDSRIEDQFDYFKKHIQPQIPQ